MNPITQLSTALLVLWLPGEVIINYTTAPVSRPVTSSHQQWRVMAYDQVLRQRQGFTDRYPIQNAGLRIIFVGNHRGSITYLVQTVLRLLNATNMGHRPTVKGTNLEDYPALEILREPEGELGTGLRIEITPPV